MTSPSPKQPDRMYFAVPDHYTIGQTFDTYAEALEAALASIKPFDGIPGSSRAFIDIRKVNDGSDRVHDRIEVFAS